MNYDLDLDLDNICRICLTQPEKLLSLFTTQIVDGYVKTLPSIVHYCLDIAIDEEDILPKQICEPCKATIITYFTFKEKCKRTEKVLNDAFLKTGHATTVKTELALQCCIPAGVKEENCIEEIQASIEQDETAMEEVLSVLDENFSNPNDINIEAEEVEFVVHVADNLICKKDFESMDISMQPQSIDENMMQDMSTENDLEEYFCAFCEKVVAGYLGKYLEHCETEHFMCTECCGTYETAGQLDDHIETDHRSISVESQVNRPKQSQPNHLFCGTCNKRWGNREQLSQHVKLHEALNLTSDNFDCYKCDQCHTVYLKSDDLENHIRSKHEPVKNTDDPVCIDYQFLEEDKPEILNYLICGFCTAKYPNMEELRCHLIIHFDSFCCPFEACGCQYDTFSRLSLHMMKKHIYGEEHFCTHCRKERFETFDQLQSHIRDGCSAKKFACHHCDKKFFSNKALQLHLKHIDGKKFGCSDCGKTFAQHGELTIHKRTHTGERPFKCTICSKTYKTSSMRAAHMDAHIDGKTFQCTVCDKMLQSRTSYRNHMKRHTVGKSYKCEVCSKSFYTKYHLHLHTIKNHNKSKTA